MNSLAALHIDQGQENLAEPLYKRAIAITEKTWWPQHPLVAVHLSDLAALYLKQKQYEKAEPLFKRTLDIYEKEIKPKPKQDEIVKTLDGLIALYRATKRDKEATLLKKRAAGILATASDATGDHGQ